MKTTKVFVWLLLFLWLLPGCPHAVDQKPPWSLVFQERPASCATDTAARDKDWQAFRDRFPFHYQTIALSEPFGDGCRTVVVAEPPPEVTLEGLKEASSVDPIDFSISRHRIGHDGWVADAVAVLPPISQEEVAEVVGELSRYVFKTAYKAYATPIGGATPSGARDLDVHVHPAEIRQWVFNRTARFAPVMGGRPMTTDEVMTPAHAGVYFLSSQPVVAWSIPRGTDVGTLAVEARQFALDSDVLFGAVANKSTVLILARERAVSVDVLPPMRFETLALLASAGEGQLAQSYERHHVLAGTYAVGKDWAPIYLSNALIDTEYGSLLDITDQLLKSWSEQGTTTYENFPYPSPPSWPFAKPAFEELKAGSLVYNWNTRGLGAQFDLGGYAIFSVRGTASHSVMYAPNDEPTPEAQTLQDGAYKWFSSLNDATLARTVQYTIFYQIAHNLGIGAKRDTSADAEPLGVEVLETGVYELLEKLRGVTAETAKAAVEKSASLHPWANDDAKLDLELAAVSRVVKYNRLLHGATDDDLRRMAKMLASPRENNKRLLAALTSGAPSDDDVEDLLLHEVAGQFSSGGIFVQGFVDIGRVKDDYVAANTKRASRWIHTPAIVVSTNVGSARDTSGGHDIDASISRFQLGQGEGGVGRRLRPQDLPRIAFSHEGGPVLGPTPIVPREPTTALRVAEPSTSVEARGFASKAGAARAFYGGWVPVSMPSPGGCGPGCIRVSRDGNGFPVDTEDGRSLSATAAAAADLVHQYARTNGKLRVELVGFSKQEARHLLWTARRTRDAEFEAVIRGKDVSAAKALAATYDLSQAKVVSSKLEEIPNGTRVVLELSLPPTAMEQGAVKVEFEATVKKDEKDKKDVSETLRARMAAIVDKVRAALSGHPVTIEETSDHLEEEVRDVFKEIGIEGDSLIDYHTQYGDVGISRRDRVRTHAGSRG